MKKILFIFAATALLFSVIACDHNTNTDDPNTTPTNGKQETPEEKKESNSDPVEEKTPETFEEMYEAGVTTLTVQTLTITAKDTSNTKIYKKSDSEIYLLSTIDVDTLDENNEEVDPPEYTLEGNFKGQIINLTKGSVLNLKDANLSNINAPAIYGEKKIEISAKKNSTNTITVTTDTTIEDKLGAVHCEKKVEIGGSGSLTITSSLYHGVKADEVQIKGSSKNLVITTPFLDDAYVSSEGSGISCKTLEVKEDKSFAIKFAGFKNGIKADKTISIASGTYDFTEVKTPLKTDTVKDEPKVTHSITVTDAAVFIIKDGQKDKVKSDTVTIPDSVWQIK